MQQRKRNNSLPLKHVCILSKSGSGKSTLLAEMFGLDEDERFIAWDWKGEWGEASIRCRTVGELYQILLAAGVGGQCRVAIQYQGENPKKAFDLVCKMVWFFASADRQTTFLVEEASVVTSPQWCPPYYKMICTQGRDLNIQMLVTSQKPKEIDKVIMSENALACVGRLKLDADRKTVSKEVGIPMEELNALKDYDFVLEADGKRRRYRTGEKKK